METRRLQFLVELSRQGSMHAVADLLNTTTSNVSQQIARLARDVGTPLIKPDGRRVKLTPAGRRLADHAVVILAAVDAAQADFDPGADPVGTIRVSGFATAIRRVLLPTVTDLAVTHPQLRVVVSEHEPAEAIDLLIRDQIDLALIYDYTLAPIIIDKALRPIPLWSTPWCLAVPAAAVPYTYGDAPAVFHVFRDHPWIANSRNDADEQVLRTIASMAGFEPDITHRADSLDLVEDLITAGLGVGLLPANRNTRRSVELLRLSNPEVQLRAHALTRRGRTTWPPLALLLHRITTARAGEDLTSRHSLQTSDP